MTQTQKLIVVPILIGLCGVLVLQHLLAENYQALGIAKYTVNSMIFVVSLLLPKPTKDHRILGWAFAFVYAADFFFVFLGTFPALSPETPLLKFSGLSVFTLGYFCFIYLALQGASWDRKEWLQWIPILLVGLPIGASCYHAMRPEQATFFFLFVPFVSFVGWCGLSSRKRPAFKPAITRLFACAGYLFFVSELGFAVGTFFPGLNRNVPWIGNWIWATYIPAWVTLLYALSLDSWRATKP